MNLPYSRIFQQLAVVLVFLVSACSDKPEGTGATRASSQTVKQKALKTSLSPSYDQKKREQYAARLEAVLKQYVKKVEALKNAPENAKNKTEPSVAHLEEKIEAVKRTLEDLNTATLESWQELKPEMHAALDNLEATYDAAVSQKRNVAEPRQEIAGGPRTVEGVIPLEKITERR